MSDLAELRQAYNEPHNSLMDMCDAGSAYVEALEAKAERLTRELEAKHQAWNHAVEEGARLGRKRDGLAKALDVSEEQRAERERAYAAEVERLTSEVTKAWKEYHCAVDQAEADLAAARAQVDGLAKVVAAATALIENHDAWLARQDVMVLDIDSEWTRLVDALRAALAALPKEDDA